MAVNDLAGHRIGLSLAQQHKRAARADRYGKLTGRLIRLSVVVLAAYVGLIGLTGYQFSRAPTGFIPDEKGSGGQRGGVVG